MSTRNTLVQDAQFPVSGFPPIDRIRDTARRALDNAEALLKHWLPDGKRQGQEWIAYNPTREDKSPGSFSVNIETGRWADFASDDKGGDLVSLISYLDGVSQSEAASRLAEFLGTAPAPAPRSKHAQRKQSAATPRPVTAGPVPEPPEAHPQLGKPTARWLYRDADGVPVATSYRFETSDDKTFRQASLTGNRWQWLAPSGLCPLYNLPAITQHPGSAVLVTEGEKACDAAAEILPGYLTTCSMGGSNAASKTDWSPLAGREVLIWPDNDKPGEKFAHAVARLAKEAGARSVRVLDIRAVFGEMPPTFDAADALSDGWKPENLAKAARWTEAEQWTLGESGESGEKPRQHCPDTRAKQGRTRANLSDEEKTAVLAKANRLLAIPKPPESEYPIDALGPLTDAARAIATGAQVRPAMAGQSVLGVAALLTQGIANVRTLESIKPLSLNLLSIAESGDGKTTADNIAQQPIQEFQCLETKHFREELEEINRIPRGRREDAPEIPREPYRITRDGTVEGLRRSFTEGPSSQAVFSSEAATMLSGYGMTPDNRAKTAATFNALWDDGQLSISRSTTGRVQIYGQRLSIHWMLQPEAARETLSDPLLSQIGFWPRFLVAWPEASAPRKARPWRADQDPAIVAFWQRCRQILKEDLPEDCTNLPVLELSHEAMELIGQFFERMEEAAKGERASLAEIKAFAIRATEQALRIAGVLTAFSGQGRIEIETMRKAIILTTYSLDTWKGIFGDREARTTRSHALLLFRWLVEQPGSRASTTAISRIGPKSVRSRDHRDTALALLEQMELITRFGNICAVEVGNERS